jgi:hypothetical protein
VDLSIGAIRRPRDFSTLVSMVDPALAGTQQRLDAFAQRMAAAGTTLEVGAVVTVFPARCVPLDHAALAWAHASGAPAPPNPATLGAELAVTTAGLAYATFPVPYVWWRPWDDVWCSMAVVGRPRWGQRTVSVFVADRVPPFEGRGFELPRGAAKAFMDFAVQRGAVSPRADP